MNDDVLELLQDLQDLIVTIDNVDHSQEYWYTSISSWIDQQRSIYEPARGECAS